MHQQALREGIMASRRLVLLSLLLVVIVRTDPDPEAFPKDCCSVPVIASRGKHKDNCKTRGVLAYFMALGSWYWWHIFHE